jgi:hypothetical protein
MSDARRRGIAALIATTVGPPHPIAPGDPVSPVCGALGDLPVTAR